MTSLHFNHLKHEPESAPRARVMHECSALLPPFLSLVSVGWFPFFPCFLFWIHHVLNVLMTDIESDRVFAPNKLSVRPVVAVRQ